MFLAIRSPPLRSSLSSLSSLSPLLYKRCYSNNKNNEGTPKKDINDVRKKVEEELKKLREGKKTTTPTTQTSSPPLSSSLSSSSLPPYIDPEKEEEKNPSVFLKHPWVKHVGMFVGFSIISFALSVYSIEADDPLYYVRNINEKMEIVHKADNKDNTEQVTAVLKEIARYSQTNDLLRRTIVQTGQLDVLLRTVETGATVEIKNLCARIISNVCLEESNKERVVREGYAQKIVSILRNDKLHQDMPLYSRKALAMALAHCAFVPHLRMELAIAGVASTLQHVQETDELKRQYFDRAISLIAGTVIPATLSGISNDPIPAFELKELEKQYEAKEGNTETIVGKVRNTLVDNGLTMYLHTSIGGAVWGACEALRKKENMAGVLRASARTALITGLVPIYFVGLGVSIYNHIQRNIESADQRFFLTLSTSMSMYPWVYLLPIVEKFSPYWLGGHVLGFTSFYAYLLFSKNDLLKSDTLLASKDEINSKKIKPASP